MRGLAVMLHDLSGNSAAVAAYNEAIGKRVSSASLADDALTLQFDDGTGIRFRDDGQSCCECRYMRTDDDLSTLAGHLFQGATLKDGPPANDEYDNPHEVQFLEIRTDAGWVTLASHNEHNGYYGGFAIVVEKLGAS